MSHLHSIVDTDLHFSINPITREILNESEIPKNLIQGDHDSERFSFSIPRYIEEHDMSLCNKVEVHFINISAANKNDKSADVYIVDDVKLSPDSNDIIVFSWLISGNATKYAGTLSFLIKFKCLTDTDIDYEWNTAVYSDISIGTGMNNGEAASNIPSDVLEAWKREVFGDLAEEIANLRSAIVGVETDLQMINEGGIV